MNTLEQVASSQEVTDIISAAAAEGLWNNDDWFSAHPEKILGEAYTTSGRFGQVTKYRGDIKALTRIDADLVPILANLPWGTSEENIATFSDSDSASRANLVNAIRKAPKSITEKTIRKKATLADPAEPKPAPQLLSVEDVFRTYNPEIDPEELKVFAWFKRQQGHQLTNEWTSLVGTGYADEERVRYWVEQGLLYYLKGELVPAFLYLAENVYERKQSLQHDEAAIRATYGDAVFERQQEAFHKLYMPIYNSRLLLDDTDVEKRLKLLPNSEIARQFKIKSLSDERPFKEKVVSATTDKRYGEIDFFKTPDTSEYQRTELAEVSLRDAFCIWLRDNRNSLEFKKGTNYFDIISIYVLGKQMGRVEEIEDKAAKKAEHKRKQANCKEEGDRLFSHFLATELLLNDRVRLETEWNSAFNGYVKINYDKVPVAFRTGKTFQGAPFDLRWEKREAVAFYMIEGTGCLAYDVGFGKTLSAIFSISQAIDCGYCKRPLIVTPNQVYRQFMAELKAAMPHLQVNDLYNLSPDYLETLKGKDGQIMKVPEGSVTFLTYEGFERIGFNDNTAESLVEKLYDILNQGGADELTKSEKKQASFRQRLETLVGKGLKGGQVAIEDLGIDFMCVDEAHNLKKVFTSVKAQPETNANGTTSKGRTEYEIQSGTPSSIALKGFMVAQFILQNNNDRNLLLLTATPFTNSPLEIFSMLSLVCYQKLEKNGLNNLKKFFDTYIQTSTELTINARLQPQRKQIVVGFNNLRALQQLVYRFINYKNADITDAKGRQVKLVRPNKYVLPLQFKKIGDTLVRLDESEAVSTTLPMSSHQTMLMGHVQQYVEGFLSSEQICAIASNASKFMDTDGNSLKNAVSDALEAEREEMEELGMDSMDDELSEAALDDSEKVGVRILKGVNMARNLALSPFLFQCEAGVRVKPTYKQYIETSPKLLYIMECVRSVRDYHLERKEKVSGQVIYMDRGVEFFPLIKEYLIKEVGYAPHEVDIITSVMSKKRNKEFVKNLFLGLQYDEATRSMKDLPDSQRVKVLIGSSTIKEGINLQNHSTVLYNCFLDWNPTDVQQLEGRVWRQGNCYGSVRIVNPVMEDSMDIFILQKLEQKTHLINQLWNSDGSTNVLDLREFNPNELKYALIKNPQVIAGLQTDELTQAIDEEINSKEAEIRRIQDLVEKDRTYKSHEGAFRKLVETYRPSKDGAERSFQTLVSVFQEVLKSQTDAEGKKMLSYHESYRLRSASFLTDRDKELRANQSQLNEAVKPFYYNNMIGGWRLVERAKREYLSPNNLTFEELPFRIEEIKAHIEQLRERRKEVSSPEAIAIRAQQVELERAQNQIVSRSLYERVEEFKRLNYLLSDVRVKEQPKPEATPALANCPPMDANGVRRIDAEALIQLQACIDAAPQTKHLHTVDDVYTPERVKVHKKIIADMMKGKQCMKREAPICVLTGGPGGSGKSHFLARYADWLSSDKVFKIDADEVRAMLPEYEGWNASNTHLETKDIVNQMLDQIGKPCEFDLVYDGTMNKARNYIPLIEKIRSLGYRIFIVFLTVPYEVSIKRALKRYQEKGRFVPLDAINECYDRGLEAFNQLKEMVDGYTLVNGETHEIIEHGGQDIPTDRQYSIQTAPPQKPVGSTASKSTGKARAAAPAKSAGVVPPGAKARAEKQLSMLEKALKYLKDANLARAEKQIKGLKMAIKYLK